MRETRLQDATLCTHNAQRSSAHPGVLATVAVRSSPAGAGSASATLLGLSRVFSPHSGPEVFVLELHIFELWGWGGSWARAARIQLYCTAHYYTYITVAAASLSWHRSLAGRSPDAAASVAV